MIEAVYQLLAALGYTHPLHPVATHIPMGMILGGVLFFIASFKWRELAETAYYCQVLALLFIPPTVILGIMDWQHRYFGKLTNYIIAKFVLAGALTVVLALAVYLHRSGKDSTVVRVVAWILSLGLATGLGFIGAQLIFS